MHPYAWQQQQQPYYPTPGPYVNAQMPPMGYWVQPNSPHANQQWTAPNQSNNKGSSGYRSTKYPNLHPILAVDTTLVRYDVSKKPRNEILATTYQTNRHSPATFIPCTHMRLVSKSFPWTIEILSQSGITCEAVWDAVYAALQEHIVDSEWGFIMMDKKRRETLEKAFKKRIQNDLDTMYKRIDYLGDNVVFKGLEKDEEYQKQRLMKGIEGCGETWMIKLGS